MLDEPTEGIQHSCIDSMARGPAKRIAVRYGGEIVLNGPINQLDEADVRARITV